MWHRTKAPSSAADEDEASLDMLEKLILARDTKNRIAALKKHHGVFHGGKHAKVIRITVGFNTDGVEIDLDRLSTSLSAKGIKCEAPFDMESRLITLPREKLLPRATAMICNDGRILCFDTLSLEQAEYAAHKVLALLAPAAVAAEPPSRLHNYHVCNISTRFLIDWTVDLNAFAALPEHRAHIRYRPLKNPDRLVYRAPSIAEGKTRLMFYRRSHYVDATGAKTLEACVGAQAFAERLLEKHRDVIQSVEPQPFGKNNPRRSARIASRS